MGKASFGALLDNIRTNHRFAVYVASYFVSGVICILLGLFGSDIRQSKELRAFSESRWKWTLYSDRPFSESAIVNPQKLIDELRSKKTALSRKILESTNQQFQELIAKQPLEPDELAQARYWLLHEVNSLLGTQAILNQELYSHLTLPLELRQILLYAHTLTVPQRIRLSRILLAYAYPEEIKNRYFSRWDYWAVAAIILTFLYMFLFWWDCYADNGRPPIITRFLPEGQHVVIQSLMAMSGVILAYSIYATIYHDMWGKLLSLAGFFATWCVIDRRIMRFLSNANKQQSAIKKEFSDMFWYIDFSFLCGILILSIGYATAARSGLSKHEMSDFFTGAIAFKVILQNTNFMAIVLMSFSEVHEKVASIKVTTK